MKYLRNVSCGYCWQMALILLLGIAVAPHAEWLTIHNDFNQFDLDGNPIRTRSGCLCKFGELYYWYGCDQGMTNQTCYSSSDLLHWTNHGNMITATRGTNRMDVLYNDSTKMYVMVMKWETEGSDAWCTRGIATSTKPTGPFTKQFDSLVYGVNTGDISVFKDDDGKAYYLYELWDNGKTSQGFSLMTSDYTGLEKKMQQWSNRDREANMMMKRRGIYYYLTSGMMGIDPTETRYWTARNLSGPWTTNLVSVIAPGDADKKSWDTQCDFAFPFKGTKDTVQMYCGDRWKRPHAARGGDYVWLPITFTQRDSVVIDYYQDWEVNPVEGTWRPIDAKRNLALQKTTTASSANGSNSASKATDPSNWQNFINSKWESASTDPQWITVDLGAAIEVNRVILKWDSSYAKSFKVQVSKDNTAWDDVYQTTKAGARSVTDETFATKTARYVRMYGTQRGTSGGYALFDFMVLNDSVTTPVTHDPISAAAPGKAVSLMFHKKNTLQYTVPFSKRVKIEVTNCQGRLAAVVVNQYKNAGVYEAVLPAGLVHGVYIITMAAGTDKLASIKVSL